jgi:hypothetical protein
MASDLIGTWDDIAQNWNKWGPPLRPCDEDITLIRRALKIWQKEDFARKNSADVLLLGVTPEIATMKFSFSTMLTAVDESANMIRYVWPGDIPNQRTAILDNWLTMKIADQSQDVVLADGSFVFFNPDEMKQLTSIVSKVLKPNGIFVVRQFISPDPKERISDVALDLSMGNITNFHIFKFRLAMALQENLSQGVSQNDIYKSVISFLPYDRKNKLSETDSINFYKDKGAKLYFPTLNEFKAILRTSFSSIEVETPIYDFGSCCPTLTVRF